MELGGLEPRPF